MQKLYEITIPGLSMTADFPAVHHRLLADFPDVVDVLAMTAPATLLVVYGGEPEVDGWIDALSDSVATRRIRLGVGGPETRRTIVEAGALRIRTPGPGPVGRSARP
jgi:hypothetical protein